MKTNKGFTLVELMVAVTIIGILATLSVPRITVAVDRARAAEGQQMLSIIAPKLHAFRAERDFFVEAATTNSSQTRNASPGWRALGFSQDPYSRYFNFRVDVSGQTSTLNLPEPIVQVNLGSQFLASATLRVNLARAEAGRDGISVDFLDRQFVSSENMQFLLPQWRGTITNSAP